MTFGSVRAQNLSPFFATAGNVTIGGSKRESLIRLAVQGLLREEMQV
jgi:hypothetical protein